MIALDTNVLVRILVEDDAAQSARASRLIEKAIRRGEMLFVPDVVVCELVWVLSGAYEFSRADISETLGELFRARELEFGSADALARALHDFQNGRGDFADYLIRAQALDAGYDVTATFDRALLKETGFVSP